MFLDLDWLSAGEFQELSVIFFPAWPNCDGNGDEVGPWSVVVDKHLHKTNGRRRLIQCRPMLKAGMTRKLVRDRSVKYRTKMV